MTQAQGSTGRLLAGRYRLDSVLGRGGMGTVWRAEDEMLGRVVAVKELRFHGGVDEEEKRRLITRTLREAKAAARIRNTSAVTVFDVVDEDDRPWIVMELVESRSLSDVIKQDGPLKPDRAAEIGLDLLGVLRSAHSHGILHRDVKPSNVLIGDDGRVVLTDFGIASVEGDPSVTSTGMLVGAPSYISPERARGQKPGPPADLWSLGATLYAMVEGKPPYDRGSAISTLTAVMTEDLKTPRNAGPLRPVIEGLLRKDPDERLDESTTTSMLRRVVAEATARAEATTRQAAATDVAATEVLPVTEEAAERKPAKDTARTVPQQAAAPKKAEQPAEAADSPSAGQARRGAGVLGGLLGTVRVGSRTAPPAPAEDDPAEPAAVEQAAVPAVGKSAKALAAELGTAAPEAAAPEAAAPEAAEPKAAQPKAAQPKPADPKPADPKPADRKPADPKPADRKPADRKAAQPKADKPKPAQPKAGAPEQEKAGASEAPATAVLPVTDSEGPAPSRPGGGTVYGSLGHRVRAWRSQPPAERTPAPRTLLVYAVVLVLLVTGVVLGVQAMSDTGGGQSGKRASGGHSGSPAPKASTGGSSPGSTPSAAPRSPAAQDGTGPGGGAGADPATTGPSDGASTGDGTGTGSASGSGGSGGSDGRGGQDTSVPDGFTMYTDGGEGFSALVPKGMKYVHQAKDGGVQLEYKDWVLIVHVRRDATDSPLDDWRSRESQSKGGWPDYRRIGDIREADFRGWKAADWEWTYNPAPATKHSLSRAFVVDKQHAYLIQWITPADQWDDAGFQHARQVSYDSFKVQD